MGGKGDGVNDKGKKQVCTHFESQTWRKNLCKNCFRTLTEHNAIKEKGKEPEKEKTEKAPAQSTEEQEVLTKSSAKKKTADKKKNGEVLASDKTVGGSSSSSASSSATSTRKDKNGGKNENKPTGNVSDSSHNESTAKYDRKGKKISSSSQDKKHPPGGVEKKNSSDIKGNGKQPGETCVNKAGEKVNKSHPSPTLQGLVVGGIAGLTDLNTTTTKEGLRKSGPAKTSTEISDRSRETGEGKQRGLEGRNLEQGEVDQKQDSAILYEQHHIEGSKKNNKANNSKAKASGLSDNTTRTTTAAECIGDKSRLLPTEEETDKNTTVVVQQSKGKVETASREKRGGVGGKGGAGKVDKKQAAAVLEQADRSSEKSRPIAIASSEQEAGILALLPTTTTKPAEAEHTNSTSPLPPPLGCSTLNYASSSSNSSQSRRGNNPVVDIILESPDHHHPPYALQPSISETESRDSAGSVVGAVATVPSSLTKLPPLQPPPPGKQAKGPSYTPPTLERDEDDLEGEGDRLSSQVGKKEDLEEEEASDNRFAKLLQELKEDTWDTSRTQKRTPKTTPQRGNNYVDQDEEVLEGRGRLLKESLTDISDVFEEPLSPRSLDKYRKELFDSDSNIASPKSPRTFVLDNQAGGNDYNKNTTTRDNNTEPLSQEAGNVSASLFYHSPEADRYGKQTTATPTHSRTNQNSQFDFNPGQSLTVYHSGESQDLGRTGAKKGGRNRRRRQSWDHIDGYNPNMAAHERTRYEVSRDEAMMEGTRMLMDNLREKIASLEDRVDRVEREKHALSDLLSVKKEEYTGMREHYSGKIGDLEDSVKRLSSEKERLLDRLKLPESERSSLRSTEIEISKLNKKLEEAENRYFEGMEENMTLKQEVKDLQTEIDEMHDQFRDDEQIEFRELQRELEMNAKNCRILQFKLRKSERRNEQVEMDKITLEEKIRQLEGRFESSDDKQQIRELEEELKMAKEVSVRLHDELELVEEKRARYEEELDRVNDILTESENRRTGLQKEVENLNSELETLSRGSKGKSFFKKDSLSPSGKPSLEKQSSSEYDIRQVMRDLQDSLERENDLKEQMEFRDGELRTIKRKLSDLEGENESLTLQLQKMSSAKSGKYFKKSSDIMEKEIVTEREHELRLQMELAEQELKVQRRKMDELEVMNEKLMKELNRLEKNLTGGDKLKSSDKDGHSTEEEKIRSMVKDIERLKWSLIEKDQEAADRQRRGSIRLKKSKSLEDDSTPEGAEYHQDLRRQLETIQQEADILRQKVLNLERENDSLSSENSKLEILLTKKQGGAIPAITTDDAAIQNIELKGRVKKVEEDNSQLRTQIRSLDERTSKLSQEVTRTLSRSYSESYDITESLGLRNKLKTYEDECNQLKKKVNDLEAKNSKLSKDLDERKHKKAKKDAKKEKEKERKEEVGKMSKDDLRHRMMQLEDEMKDVRTAIKNREEENARLETEISEYKEDMDKMFSSFRVREQELVEEMESLQNKNTVISNLLEIVTERAESTQKELYKSVREASRSPSALSDLSGVSAGSDEVFADGKETKLMESKLEEQFMKKIDWLERNLAEERQKVQAAERKLEMSGDHHSKSEEEKKLHQKERDILQQEVSVAQNQLKDANKKVKELRAKLDKITQENDHLKALEKEKSQRDTEIKKLKDELDKEEKAKSKKSAAWIWEKQSLEAELKDHKKKVEELHAEVKKQQFKWKMAGEDIEREQKQKLQMQEQLEQLTKTADKSKTEIQGLKDKLNKSEDKHHTEAEKWEKERKSMERQQKQTEKEVRNKEDVIKQKDEIIKRKEDLITQKGSALMERDDKIHQYEVQIQTHSAEIQKRSTRVLELEREMGEVKATNKDMTGQIKDRDKKIKNLNEDIRNRDDRLHEKDDILNKLNRKLTDRESEVQDMDQTIRQAMKKLQDRENDVKVAEKRCLEFESQATEFRTSTKELKAKLADIESKHTAEITQVMKKREKLQGDLDALKEEKKALLNELEESKEKLNRENERLKKDKTRLEVEVKQANEKVNSMRLTGGMKESEVLKTLTGEKDNLIAEKHKLKDELNKLKRESKAEERKWKSEREGLEKAIAEKTKMVADNSAICERMQKDMDMLKQQIADESCKKTSIPVLHESSKTTTATGGSEELKAKLERQDLMYKAEKIGLEELYEGKVKILQEQLNQAQEHVMSLRGENDQQLELIQSSRAALSDLRKRYDSGVVSWNDERDHLLKKLRDTEERLVKLSSLDKDMEDVKNKLKKEESKRREAENKLASEKNAWNSERSQLQAKVRKDEQAGGRSASTVSEFRAKFEKFGGPTGKAKAGSTGKTSGEETVDSKLKEETQKLIKNLQTQIKEIEKARESDRKELQIRFDGNEKTWTMEKKKLQERNKKLEVQSQEVAGLQKCLVDLQYKTHEDKEQWSLERNRILKELEDTRKHQLEEKVRINDLLAEIQKLRSITSTDDKSSDTDRKSEVAKGSGTKVVISKPVTLKRQTSKDEQITEYVQEVLQRISKLLEDYEKVPPPRRTDRKTHLAPPSFRRSLSTTEVELGLDSYLYNTPDSSNLPTSPTFHQKTTHNALLSTSSSDAPVRLRYNQRSISTSENEYETKTIDRHMRGRTEKRSSKYLSGSQSAYGSRDTSPDTSTDDRKSSSSSAYPMAPPSMIISPSHTPRRAKSKERKTLSKYDLEKLQQKLGEIDHQQKTETCALVKERGRGVRVLTKSVSVDNTQHEHSVLLRTQQEEEIIASPQPQLSSSNKPTSSASSVGKRFATIAKLHSKKYDDAPLSNTLLASIRLGELVITPGVEELTKKVRKLSKKRSDSSSPHTARKSFFDNYHFSPKSYFSWPKRDRTKSVDIPDHEPAEKDSHYYESDTDNSVAGRTTDDDSASTTSISEKPEKKSKFSLFKKGVKDKRKLFTMKRSSSVENSPIHSTVVKAGVQTLPHGAPSTYETPDIPVVEPLKLLATTPAAPHTSSSSRFKRLSKHQRAASVDASVIMSTSGHSSSDIVSSIIAQREQAIARSKQKQGKSSTESHETQGKRATSVEPQPTVPQPSSLTLRFTPRSMSARWRSNPSFRLAAERPIIIKKDPIDRPKQVLNGKMSDSVSSFNETLV